MNTQFREDIQDAILSMQLPAPLAAQIIGAVTAVGNNYDIVPRSTALMCVDDAIADNVRKYLQHLELKQFAPGTLENKKLHLKALFTLVHKSPLAMDSDDLLAFQYLYQKEHKCTARSLNKVLETVRDFFGWLVVRKKIDTNPSLILERVKEEKGKPKKVLTPDELERIREAARLPREKALIELLYSSGIRIAEAAHLKWADVNLETLDIVVLGKGSKYRTVPISTKAKRALTFLKNQNPDSLYVFQRLRSRNEATETPITTTALRRELEAIALSAGVEGVTPHTFRRTTATVMVGASNDITAVQKILGHANVQTTLIYAQISYQHAKEVHSKSIA